MSTARRFILLPLDAETRKSCCLWRNEFWKRERKHEVMELTKPTRNVQRPGNWRSLAERARLEMDPEKLLNLVSELNNVLKEQQRNFSDWKAHENRSREWHSN